MSTPDAPRRSHSLSRSLSRSMSNLRRLARKLSDKRPSVPAHDSLAITKLEASQISEREVAPPPIMVDGASAAGAVVAAGQQAMRRRKATAPDSTGPVSNPTKSTIWRDSMRNETTMTGETRNVDELGRGVRKEGWRRSQSFGGKGYFDTRQKGAFAFSDFVIHSLPLFLSSLLTIAVADDLTTPPVRPDVSGMSTSPPVAHFVHTSSLSTFAPRAPLIVKTPNNAGGTMSTGGNSRSSLRTMTKVHDAIAT